jgi:hypothetical protein
MDYDGKNQYIYVRLILTTQIDKRFGYVQEDNEKKGRSSSTRLKLAITLASLQYLYILKK